MATAVVVLMLVAGACSGERSGSAPTQASLATTTRPTAENRALVPDFKERYCAELEKAQFGTWEADCARVDPNDPLTCITGATIEDSLCLSLYLEMLQPLLDEAWNDLASYASSEWDPSEVPAIREAFENHLSSTCGAVARSHSPGSGAGNLSAECRARLIEAEILALRPN